ncbi:hypothetical protein AB7M35_000477 [Amorphus suaedae]
MQKTDDKRADQSPAAGKRLAWSPPRLKKASIASETQAGPAGTTDSGVLS